MDIATVRGGGHVPFPVDGVSSVRQLMKTAFAIVTAGVLGISQPAGVPAQDQKPPHAFVKLLNGEDLAGWKTTRGPAEVWQAEKETVRFTGTGAGWLTTEKVYSDFVLKLEYRLAPESDAGIGLRLPAQGEPAIGGIEIQLLGSSAAAAAGLPPERRTGAVVDEAPSQREAPAPKEEWNSLEITCRGPQLKVVVNGETINEVDLDDYGQAPEDGPKGSGKRLSERSPLGQIGLQGSAALVEYRAIEVRDLTTATPSGVRYVDLKEGQGNVIGKGATVAMHFTCRLSDGTRLESTRDKPKNKPRVQSLQDDMIAGLKEAIPGMKVGGRRKLIIPAALGYGEEGVRAKDDAGKALVPPNATLIFDVEVLEVK
jgi:Domain of Unknown Function (DUF1080)/FKBP-type peptidyl-prolyl cis-trans isomerase